MYVCVCVCVCVRACERGPADEAELLFEGVYACMCVYSALV
jgi:hypothetical protein